MKRRFDLPMLLLTLVLSTLGMAVCLPLRDSLGDSVPGRAVWCALWFAVPLVLGLLGVEASLALNSRRFRPIRKRNVLAGFLAALLLGTVIGGGGGMLCMLEIQTTTEIIDSGGKKPSKNKPPKDDPEPPEEQDPSKSDPLDDKVDIENIVMLIDASDSARQDDEDRLVPCRMIDSLDEEISMQVAVFAYAPTAEDVRYKTDFLPLEDDVKEEFKEFIQTTDIVGGTSFEGPIQLALETLEGRSDAAVIMFTDGDSPLSPQTCDEVLDSGVRLYLMRANPARTDNAQRLVQLARATGGDDLPVSSIVGGRKTTANSQASTKKDSVQEEKHTELTFGEALPPDGFNGDSSIMQIAVCILTYVLYAVLVTVVYYRRLTLAGLAGSLCTGCLTVCAVTIDQRLCIPVTAILLLGAYTIYQVKEETAHV